MAKSKFLRIAQRLLRIDYTRLEVNAKFREDGGAVYIDIRIFRPNNTFKNAEKVDPRDEFDQAAKELIDAAVS